jgi:uncharacterized protein YccT (UPF0319 family)
VISEFEKSNQDRINENAPRFRNHKDANEAMFGNRWDLAIPRYIESGGKITTNPDWINAPIGMHYIFHPKAMKVKKCFA